MSETKTAVDEYTGTPLATARTIWMVRLEYGLAAALCLLSLLFLYRTHLFSGALHFTLDKIDPLIQASILEHWYGVFRGWYHWRDPIFFYPIQRVLGYNDAYFLYGLSYSALRTLGLGPLIAMELTTAMVRVVGFSAAWVLMRRYFHLSVLATAFGAVLMTIANGIYVGTTHTQLATVAFVPLVFCLAAGTYELVVQNRQRAAALTAAALGLLLAGWINTAFYTFWFTGFFVLVTLCVATILDHTAVLAVMRDILAGRRWLVLMPGIAIFLGGLVPFALIYVPSARITGMYPFSEVKQNIPHLIDFINLGPDNLLWSNLLLRLREYLVGSTNLGLYTGFTPIELATLAVVLLTGFRAAGDTAPLASLVYRSLLVAIFVSMILQVQVHGITLWAFIYKLVPGARALRVVFRFQLVLLTVGAVLVAVALDKLARLRQPGRILALSLGALIIFEQVNTRQIATLTHADVAVLQAVPSPPKNCREFYTTEPLGVKEQDYAVEAMMLATKTRLPTVLGWDSIIPPSWNLYEAYAADYEPRVYAYAEHNGLLPGLCAFNLTTLLWRVVDGPPAVKRVPDPLGGGLDVGETVSFARGQPGVAMLTDGWSEPEGFGTWATGTQSRLSLRLYGDSFMKTGVILRFATWFFLPPNVNSKKLDIFVGDAMGAQPVAQWSLGPEAENRVKVLCIPTAAIAADHSLTLTFKAERSYSPSEVTGAGDRRVLDFGILRLSVDAGPCPVPSRGW